MTQHFDLNTSWIAADWPAPSHIHAGTTTRIGGHSQGIYQGLNLGDHVGDDPQTVQANRDCLTQGLNLPQPPAWLKQIHSNVAVCANQLQLPAADASFSNSPNTVCAVLTADCLPVLFCDHRGSCWAASHAGWRGLAGGILENTIQQLPAAPSELMAWLGPAIGPKAFEVGQDVYDAFCRRFPEAAKAFVATGQPQKYRADIYQLARLVLTRAGVTDIYGGGLCTVSQPERFFSYRRDGETGRMASLIWGQ